MALGVERSPAATGGWNGSNGHVVRVPRALASAGPRLLAWFFRLPLVRFFTGSLLRRILVSNLVGLGLLLAGILYLSQHHAWLIDAKRESLRAQGEIIAAAIAANATVETEGLVLDPDKLPAAEGSRIPFRDDGFAALELSVRPERVGPVLRKLIQPTNTRARIYGRDGTLIIDSAMLLQREKARRPEPADGRPRLKDFWTRLQHWMIAKELPVYKEIGMAKGTAYPEVRMALSGATTPMLLLNEKGEQIVSVAVPIQRAKVVQGVLLLSTRPGEIDEILSEERAVILAIAALALAATIVTSLLLARTVAGPMSRLSEAAEIVSRDITAARELPEYGSRSDEVGRMASAFRAMTGALYRRIEASEKFAADVAHELKNPLTAARSVAESLAYAKTDAERDHLVQQITSELKRLNRLITDVSNASRLDAELAREHMSPLNITVMLTNVRDVFRDILSSDARRVALVVEPPPFDGAYIVNGNDGRLGQVLTNLVDNALSFSPENGLITVRARRRGAHVEFAVEDEGLGVPPDQIETIFERFYTDRPSTDAATGKNSGLGLSISREIVNAHGGAIWAENRFAPGDEGGTRTGARFVVRLPGQVSGIRHQVSGKRKPGPDLTASA